MVASDNYTIKPTWWWWWGWLCYVHVTKSGDACGSALSEILNPGAYDKNVSVNLTTEMSEIYDRKGQDEDDLILTLIWS